MSFRGIVVTASILALLILAAIPVDAAPILQTGTHSSYNLSASISFIQACVPDASSSFVCPLISVCNPLMETCGRTTDMTGTIGWTVTDLTRAAASLNVTRDLTISSSDSTRPAIQSIGSFNESINLATRLVSLFPTLAPEMEQILQMAQSTAATSLTGVSLPDSMATLESTIPLHQFYTMWWVNGPLKLNQTIPVLVFPTNVTGSTNVDLGGSLGTRDAWALDFNFSRAMIAPVPQTTPNTPINDNLRVGFVFNYDKRSDLLLSATADVQSAFQSEITIPPPPCSPSPSMVCPAAPSPTTIVRSFSLNIEATLKLSSTTFDLDHRMTVPPPSQDTGGTQSNGGSNNGSGSDTESNGAGSTNSGNQGTTGSTSQPSGNSNQPNYGAQAFGGFPWTYALIGILAAIVIGFAVWIGRIRSKNRGNIPSGQTVA